MKIKMDLTWEKDELNIAFKEAIEEEVIKNINLLLFHGYAQGMPELDQIKDIIYNEEKKQLVLNVSRIDKNMNTIPCRITIENIEFITVRKDKDKDLSTIRISISFYQIKKGRFAIFPDPASYCGGSEFELDITSNPLSFTYEDI